MDRRQVEREAMLKPYSPVQLLFLLRFVRMLRLRQRYVGQADSEPWLTELLSRSIYSTFCDCQEQGVGNEARSLMARSSLETGT